jgi:hypothetical protein
LLPPGPPFATSGRFGPRTQISSIPYFIGAPGAYYLSNSLIQVLPGAGITIGSSNVTIDLNGHALIGAGFVGDSAIVLAPGGPWTSIEIHNGHIAMWGAAGINLFGAPAQAFHIHDIISFGNTGNGVNVPDGSIVRNVIASENVGWGLQVDDYCKVTNCVALSNDFDGIFTAFGCHVSDCVASFNSMDGFSLGATTVTIGSSAVSNGMNGFEVGFNNRVTDCSASNNGFGGGFGAGFFCAGPGSIVGGCAASNNFGSGFDSPAIGPPGNSVHDSIATFNGFGAPPPPAPFGPDGFTNFITVTGCTANSNAENGIQCGFASHVFRNTCDANTGSGIIATGDGNTIQNNHVAFNGLEGINTAAFNPGPGGNLISANTAHFNLVAAVLGDDFLFGPFDVFGPIILPVPGPLPLASANGNVSYP